MKKIRIVDITPICMSENDGTILRGKILTSIHKDDEITLDFDKVKLFASPFFNASIGFIISEYGLDLFLRKVKIENLHSIGKSVIDLVIKNAVEYSKLDAKEKETISEILQNLEE